MQLVLPYPPSMNRYWRAVKGRNILSAEGRQYRQRVEASLMQMGVQRQDGRLSVHLTAYMPDNRKRDLDNLLKATLDGLAHGGAYQDDSQIDQLTIVRGGVDKEFPRVLVEVQEVMG